MFRIRGLTFEPVSLSTYYRGIKITWRGFGYDVVSDPDTWLGVVERVYWVETDAEHVVITRGDVERSFMRHA